MVMLLGEPFSRHNFKINWYGWERDRDREAKRQRYLIVRFSQVWFFISAPIPFLISHLMAQLMVHGMYSHVSVCTVYTVGFKWHPYTHTYINADTPVRKTSSNAVAYISNSLISFHVTYNDKMLLTHEFLTCSNVSVVKWTVGRTDRQNEWRHKYTYAGNIEKLL